jgi:hypothetical protein
MFDKNILTFNPGWDSTCSTLTDFDDVRDIQRALKRLGMVLASVADESTTGPASLMLLDPDGTRSSSISTWAARGSSQQAPRVGTEHHCSYTMATRENGS